MVIAVIPERGVAIQTTGALIQGVWGNGRIDAGTLVNLSEGPEGVLTAARLDVSMRGSVILGGMVKDFETLKAAAELPVRGLILSSIFPSLIQQARKMDYPIVAIDGFGPMPMNSAAYKLLSTNVQNTYAGLILPGLAAPFGVFLMTQYFKAIPIDIEEAAMLDNASRLKTFVMVVLPLTLPAQATLGIFTFLACWNDYLWPLVIATKPEMYTLTRGLASTQTNFAQSEGLGFLMAQAVFAGLPVLIIYLFFQKYLVTAVAGTGR